MLWLIPAVLGSLFAAWTAWSRGLQVPAFLLLALAFALVFALGRRIESGRDKDWQDAAAQVHGNFRAALPPADLAGFGAAPWTAWAADGELQFPRAIDGRAAQPPFTLLQVRYSVRERRGEEHPDSWYEVTVAAVPLRHATAPHALVPIDDGDHAGAQNGQTLFLWKKGSPGAGASLPAAALPGLLQHARTVAARPPTR